jgi:hypothetical protein
MPQAGGGFESSALDERTVEQAEVRLGFRLPSILKSVYREIGNGGFGPGYGLLPLVSCGLSDVEEAVKLYVSFCSSDPEDAAWLWPRGLLPFCDWGCAIRSCVDCNSSSATVLTFDPNVRKQGEAMSIALAATHSSVEAWFHDWVAGVKIWDLMVEPDPSRAIEMRNPFTGKPVTLTPKKLKRPLGQ